MIPISQPRLRVRASGHQGHGYGRPARPGDPFKEIKNADGDTIKVRTDVGGRPIIDVGVTTVLGVLHSEGLGQWVADMTAAYAVENIDALLNRDSTQGWGFLRFFHKRKPDFDNPETDIRAWHSGVLNDLANLGTWIHEYIEADLLGEFTPDPLRDEHVQMANVWHEWRAENEINARAVELTVFNEDEGYAGTLDLIADINGVAQLADIKSSRLTRDNHRAQLAALAECSTTYVEQPDGFWVESEIPAYSGASLLHVRPDDVDNQGNPIPAFFKHIPASDDELDAAWDLFMGQLMVKRAEKRLRTLAASGIVSGTNKGEEDNA